MIGIWIQTEICAEQPFSAETTPAILFRSSWNRPLGRRSKSRSHSPSVPGNHFSSTTPPIPCSRAGWACCRKVRSHPDIRPQCSSRPAPSQAQSPAFSVPGNFSLLFPIRHQLRELHNRRFLRTAICHRAQMPIQTWPTTIRAQHFLLRRSLYPTHKCLCLGSSPQGSCHREKAQTPLRHRAPALADAPTCPWRGPTAALRGLRRPPRAICRPLRLAQPAAPRRCPATAVLFPFARRALESCRCASPPADAFHGRESQKTPAAQRPILSSEFAARPLSTRFQSCCPSALPQFFHPETSP